MAEEIPMTTKSSWLSREQTAQSDFLTEVSKLKTYVGDLGPAGFKEAIDGLTSATSRFGDCELRIRAAERFTVIGVFADEVTSLTDRGLASNERGLAALGAFTAFVDGLEKVPTHKGATERWAAESKDIRDQWREQLAQLDLGPADAKHLVGMTDECFSSIDTDGMAGLARYLRGHVEELDKVRRTPERGTWANSFPWWKIVAAAIWLGVTAYAVWQAVTYGAPWWSIAMIIFVALVGTILLALGC
jgi:hypothetical protein